MTSTTTLTITLVIACWLPGVRAEDVPVVRVAIHDYDLYEELKVSHDSLRAAIQVELDCVRTSATRAMRDREHAVDVVLLELPDEQALVSADAAAQPLLDLSQLLAQDHLEGAFPTQRLALCSRAGRIVALPRDVHPIMMVYPRHLAAALGVDPSGITGWEQALAVGRDLRHRHPEARLLSFTKDGSNDELMTLLAQRDAHLVDPGGRITLATPEVVATISWYIRAVRGPEAICAPLDGDQDGFTYSQLCRVVSDRRIKSLVIHAERYRCSLGLSRLPAWNAGGRRTSSLSACSALEIGILLSLPYHTEMVDRVRQRLSEEPLPWQSVGADRAAVVQAHGYIASTAFLDDPALQSGRIMTMGWSDAGFAEILGKWQRRQEAARQLAGIGLYLACHGDPEWTILSQRAIGVVSQPVNWEDADSLRGLIADRDMAWLATFVAKRADRAEIDHWLAEGVPALFCASAWRSTAISTSRVSVEPWLAQGADYPGRYTLPDGPTPRMGLLSDQATRANTAAEFAFLLDC